MKDDRATCPTCGAVNPDELRKKMLILIEREAIALGALHAVMVLMDTIAHIPALSERLAAKALEQTASKKEEPK